MVAVSHSVLVHAVPYDWFGGIVAVLVELAEDSRAENGRILLPDGKEAEGVRLVTGRHLRRGARYSVADESATCLVTVKEWDRRRTLRAVGDVEHPEGRMTWEAALRGTGRPRRAEAKGEAQFTGTPRMLSAWAGSVRLRFDDWWAAAGGEPDAHSAPLRIRLRGKPVQAEIRAVPRPSEDGHWLVEVTLTGRGRGLLRPLLALVLPLARRRLQLGLAQALDSLADGWNEHLPPALELDRDALREEILRQDF